jgi:hypothetical protein
MVENSPKVAVLEHLTGPSRGTVSWLGDVELSAVLDESRVTPNLPLLTDTPRCTACIA